SAQFFQDAEHPQNFVAFAAVRENNDDIAPADAAQIAMQCIGGAKKMTGSAGGAEGSGQLSRDMPCFADTTGEDRASAGEDQPNRAIEMRIKDDAANRG